MSKRLVLSIAVLMALSVAGLWAAQQDSRPPEHEGRGQGMGGPPPAMGTITSVGVDRLEIKKPDGTAQTILVNDQTHFRERKGRDDPPQELQLEDLKVGDHVIVRGNPNGDKQIVAAGVNRVTGEMFQMFQQFQGGGGPGGGGNGPGGGGGGMAGTRAGGEILSIDQNQIKVRGRRGERIIVVNDKTTFMKQDKTITLKDLKVGDRIFAMGSEADGKFQATEIRTGFPGQGRGGWGGPPPQQ